MPERFADRHEIEKRDESGKQENIEHEQGMFLALLCRRKIDIIGESVIMGSVDRQSVLRYEEGPTIPTYIFSRWASHWHLGKHLHQLNGCPGGRCQTHLSAAKNFSHVLP